MHRTILVVDVEGYGDWRRSNFNQVVVRNGMYQALQSAFEQTGIEWAACYREDRGDGLFVLAPATIEKALFSGSFPLTLADRLHAHNKTHEPEENIRLRMALHAGEVEDDQHGVAGTALNQAFRLVEAAQLKAALKSSAGVLAVIASSWFYGDVIRHRKEFRPDTYLPVMVNEKETTTVGWVALPDHPAPPSDGTGTWRVRILDSAGHVHGAGVLVHGRYVITAAIVIERALGLPPAAGPPSGQILFDVPKRPQLGTRRAETIWWPSPPSTGGGGLAGLSVTGPALRGIDAPPLRRVGLSDPRIIRVHRFPAAENGPAEVKAWGRLPGFGSDNHEPIALAPIADFGPYITDECSGADVVDAETGAVLGVTLTVPQPGNGVKPVMISVDSLAAHWPLLGRIVTAAEREPRPAAHDDEGFCRGPRSPAMNSGQPDRLTRSDFIRLIDECWQVPELATAQSRHMMASELPLEIALTAPRSAVDRADLAALLWACTKSPAHLTKFRRQVQKKARPGNGRRELLKDLDRFVLP